MKKIQLQELQRINAELKNEYPSDNLILNYKDYLKQRNCLRFHQYNKLVLHNLLKLVIELWSSNERISRISLLISIKQYIVGLRTKNQDVNKFNELITIENAKLVFQVVKLILEQNETLSVNQKTEALAIANNLLINLALEEVEELWFCDNVSEYEFVINRLLRYPKKSTVISKWALENYNNPLYYFRKAELSSWLLDQNPNFEISLDEFKQEFKSYFKWEIGKIKEYISQKKAELEINKLLRQTNALNDAKIVMNSSTLVLPKRKFQFPVIEMKNGDALPDLKLIKEKFYKDAHVLHKKYMIWAIHYSRLDNKKKAQLMRKYYDESTHSSFIRVLHRSKNTELIDLLIN